MEAPKAWVTLATNDSYSLGALVLAHSLRRVATKYSTVVMITPNVTPIMRERLSSVYSQVVVVDVLDSQDSAHLALLSRPELGITFTKLHCWTLTNYSKCVFLDADTLVLQNCDELFEREEFSAAPDVGWPDCFNSGVFVFQPSNETFQALLNFAKEKGSFDGGDQGLLNLFFSKWATEDIAKHLPFLYNVCSTSFYSYLPALKQFGGNIKILHFIGNIKPWLVNFNWGSRTVQESGHLQPALQHWWDIFLDNVHPNLDAAMDQWECGAQDSNSSHYIPPIEPDSQFPWHRNPHPPVQRPSSPQHDHTEDFHDPWDYYVPAPVVPENNHMTNNVQIEEQIPNNEIFEMYNETYVHNENCVNDQTNEENFIPPVFISKPWYECNSYEDDSASTTDDWYAPSIANATAGSAFEISNGLEDSQSTSSKVPDYEDEYEIVETDQCMYGDEDCGKPPVEPVKPRHPYDNYYLLHQTIIGHDGCKRCTHEDPPPPAPSPSPVELVEEVDLEIQAGVAGALSQLSIGASEQSPAVEEHLRRQGWEAGNIDYMGADSFDNIWAKISSTLSGVAAQGSPQSPPAPEPSPQPQESCLLEKPAEPIQEASACPLPSKPEAPACPLPSAPEAPACPLPPKQVEAPVCPLPSKPEAPACPLPPKQEAPACPLPSKPEAPACPLPSKQESPIEQAKPSTPVTESIPESAAPATEAKSQEKDGNLACLRPKEKLICHLKPATGTDSLLTPESEHEDAATIAQKIIASEEALSSPIITSPASPVSAQSQISSTPVPQNKEILSVDTEIPETPPVPGPVSLAQIGIISRDTKKNETGTLSPLKPTEKETSEEACKTKKAAPKKPQPPMPKTKSLDVEGSSESVKKVEAPVPPPRKKEKKPKK